MNIRIRMGALLVTASILLSAFSGCGMPSTKSGGEADAGPQENAASASAPAPSQAVSGEGEKVTLRVVDWSDSSKARRDAFHAGYAEKVNPDVAVEYTVLTQDQFKNTVITMIKSGDAPDLFPIPIGMKLPLAIEEGWYVHMNDYVDEGFFNTFIEGTIIEGIHKLDGKVYTLPEKQVGSSYLFYYNADILEECGLEPPKTYSEFISACKTVTEKGAGRYYGLIDGGKQINRLDGMVRALANVAGGKVASPNLALTVDGRAPYDTAAMVGAFDLLHQLQADGSVHPDTVNLSAPEAREIFAQGEAAFLCQGNWCIATWGQNNPDFHYGVMAVPVPDDGAKGRITYDDTIAWLGIYAQSKHPAEAGEYLTALFSEDYQKGNVQDGECISVVKGVNETYLSNPIARQYYDIMQETAKPSPVATARDLRVNDFYAVVKDIQPSLGSLAQGVLAGSIADYEGALKTLADETTAEWKRASGEVGLDYGVFEFPNWDLMKGYSAGDYAALA